MYIYYIIITTVLLKNVNGNLATKVNSIDTNWFVLKAQYNTDKSGFEKKLMTLARKYLLLVELFKKQIIILRSLRLKVKHLLLLTLLLLPFLMLLKIRHLVLII